MDAKELRIGNWVNYKMYGNRPPLLKQIAGINYHHAYFEKFGNDGATIHSLEGVQLTTEIIEKCGFVGKYKSCGYVYNYMGFEIISQDTGDYGNDIKDYVLHFYYNYKGQPIYYLHQLQNLYFAIYGEELKINNL